MRNFSIRFVTVLAVVSLGFTAHATSAAEAKRPLVIVISVDGLGAKLLSSLPPNDVPTMTKLAQDGDQAIRAETVLKAQTIPGHASMLSGVDTAKHLRTENELTAILKKIEVKTIFDLVKLNGLKSAAYFGKEKLRFMFDTGAIDVSVSPRLWPFKDLWGRWPGVVTSHVEELLRAKPDFLFVHYAITDTIGHIFQWESAPQRAAVRAVDASIGEILAPLKDYVVILTADHGGHAGSHGHMVAGEAADARLEDVESDLVIPWIVYGRHARMKNPKDVVKVYDTAATAAALLDLDVPKDWDWDGVNRVELEK